MVLAMIGFSLPVAGEPKAYEVVRYRGQAAGMTIALDFGDGYPEASVLKITQKGKSAGPRFVFAESESLRFVPENKGTDDAEVVFEMEPDAAPPSRLKGVYRAIGKTIPFVLTIKP